MFTSTIGQTGRIRGVTVTADGGETAIAAEKRLDGLRVGESIAVMGFARLSQALRERDSQPGHRQRGLSTETAGLMHAEQSVSA